MLWIRKVTRWLQGRKGGHRTWSLHTLRGPSRGWDHARNRPKLIYIWSNLNHRTRAVYATQKEPAGWPLIEVFYTEMATKTEIARFWQVTAIWASWHHKPGNPIEPRLRARHLWTTRQVESALSNLYLGLLTEQRDLHGPRNLALVFDSWASCRKRLCGWHST